MTTAATTHDRLRTTSANSPLRVTLYDRVSSMLIALLIMFGASALFLLIVWFTNRVFAKQETVPVFIQDVGGGTMDGVPGESMEIESPNPDEIAEETELEEEPELEETLAMMVDAISTRQADLADPSLTEEISSSRTGQSSGDGRAPGLGYGTGEPGIPRGQRWEIRFASGSTIDEYAAQLDYFGIELGVIGATSTIQYATNLASGGATRTGSGADEGRLYMSWQTGTLRQADRTLLSRAGVNTDGKLVVQFYPGDLENRLAELEQAFRNRTASEIRKTIFGVRRDGGAYEFFVIDQQYL